MGKSGNEEIGKEDRNSHALLFPNFLISHFPISIPARSLHCHFSSAPVFESTHALGRATGGEGIGVLIMLTTLATTALVAQAVPNLLWLAIVFFVIAIVAYVLGARGVAGMSAGIGRTLLFVFVILAVIVAIFSLMGRGTAV
jgi:uncharacterized membrane protein YtjA (UPF0391 family)